MIKSKNYKIDLKTPATHLQGLTSRGNIMIGDEAFEYYNERNINDYVQIPRNEIDLITAEVIFKNKITRFAIHTKKDGDFIFSSNDNKMTLRAINKYIPDDKLRKSLTFKDYLRKLIKR